MTGNEGYSTRDAAEVRGRIADILGYCNLDGRLHDPGNFDKKFLRSKWVCPDCNTVAGKVAYKRAQELQWLLQPPQGGGGSGAEQPTRDELEEAQEKADRDDETTDDEPEGADEEEASDDDGTDDGPGDTDSEDVKERIENAQADIEDLEEAAEQ